MPFIPFWRRCSYRTHIIYEYIYHTTNCIISNCFCCCYYSKDFFDFVRSDRPLLHSTPFAKHHKTAKLCKFLHACTRARKINCAAAVADIGRRRAVVHSSVDHCRCSFVLPYLSHYYRPVTDDDQSTRNKLHSIIRKY